MQRRSKFDPNPVTLPGNHVRLEPLEVAHAADLFVAGREPAIWAYLPRAEFANEQDAFEWVNASRAEMLAGRQVVFAIRELTRGHVIGSTRFMNIRREHRGLEIGWTWIAPEFQRSAVNTECKFLLLTHAFEELGAIRVEFKTDARNEKSQRALERIGAFREGTLRRHMIRSDGFVRDSVYFSIVADEWDVRKKSLRRLLERRPPS